MLVVEQELLVWRQAEWFKKVKPFFVLGWRVGVSFRLKSFSTHPLLFHSLLNSELTYSTTVSKITPLCFT